MVMMVDAIEEELIINHHGPKTRTSHVWPMESGMDHDCAGFHKDGLNSPFCNAVLVMGTNATEFNVLKALFNLIKKAMSSKDTIVRLVGVNGNPQIKHMLLG